MQRLICRFAYNFCKLHWQTSARLLDVKRVRFDDIDAEARIYDCQFWSKEYEIRDYRLDPGAYLRVTFIGNKGIPFTTYRTDTPEHFKKYTDNIGKVFEIYIEEN